MYNIHTLSIHSHYQTINNHPQKYSDLYVFEHVFQIDHNIQTFLGNAYGLWDSRIKNVIKIYYYMNSIYIAFNFDLPSDKTSGNIHI